MDSNDCQLIDKTWNCQFCFRTNYFQVCFSTFQSSKVSSKKCGFTAWDEQLQISYRYPWLTWASFGVLFVFIFLKSLRSVIFNLLLFSKVYFTMNKLFAAVISSSLRIVRILTVKHHIFMSFCHKSLVIVFKQIFTIWSSYP